MVAKIEYQHVEFGEELPPVWIVGVGREAVAMRDQQPDTVRVAGRRIRMRAPSSSGTWNVWLGAGT